MSHTEPADEPCLSGLVEPDSHTISTMQERPDSVGFHVESGSVETETTIKEVAALCEQVYTVGCVGHNAWM